MVGSGVGSDAKLAKSPSESLGQASVLGNLVDGLARHAQCTGQGGLIAVIEAEGVRFLDGEGFFHGWR